MRTLFYVPLQLADKEGKHNVERKYFLAHKKRPKVLPTLPAKCLGQLPVNRYKSIEDFYSP